VAGAALNSPSRLIGASASFVNFFIFNPLVGHPSRVFGPKGLPDRLTIRPATHGNNMSSPPESAFPVVFGRIYQTVVAMQHVFA
jgi:hypothetical protein